MKTKLLLFLLVLPAQSFAQTYTYSVLANFPASGGPASANSPLTIDSKGNLYGSSEVGGTHDYGTVFEVTSTGVLDTLYSFGTNHSGPYSDGATPIDNLVRDKAGNLYGMTITNAAHNCIYGINACGTVFEVTSAGVETILYDFPQCGEGSIPFGALTLDSAGNLYGNYDCPFPSDAVFKLTPSGEFSNIYSDPPQPTAIRSTFIINSAGNLYGYGYDRSTLLDSIIELTPEGKLTTLYTFASGLDPFGKLTQDAAGNFFGVTDAGTGNSGSVFEFTAKNVYSTLYFFCSEKNCADGQYPAAFLTLDSSGNLYGLTYNGGANNDGVVFKLTPSGQESVIYNFVDPNAGGGTGRNGLVMDKSGNLYGTDNNTSNLGCVGGNGTGCVYKLTKN